MLVEKNIRLKAHGDVEEFVAAAGNCDFDVNCGYDRIMIDAKSILGVLGLGFTRVLKVSYIGSNEKFEQTLEKYSVVCD
jgi:hypothetical protein